MQAAQHPFKCPFEETFTPLGLYEVSIYSDLVYVQHAHKDFNGIVDLLKQATNNREELDRNLERIAKECEYFNQMANESTEKKEKRIWSWLYEREKGYLDQFSQAMEKQFGSNWREKTEPPALGPKAEPEIMMGPPSYSMIAPTLSQSSMPKPNEELQILVNSSLKPAFIPRALPFPLGNFIEVVRKFLYFDVQLGGTSEIVPYEKYKIDPSKMLQQGIEDHIDFQNNHQKTFLQSIDRACHEAKSKNLYLLLQMSLPHDPLFYVQVKDMIQRSITHEQIYYPILHPDLFSKGLEQMKEDYPPFSEEYNCLEDIQQTFKAARECVKDGVDLRFHHKPFFRHVFLKRFAEFLQVQRGLTAKNYYTYIPV